MRALALVSVLCLSLWTCGGEETTAPDGEETPAPSAVVSVVVTPAADSLFALGYNTQLTATARDASGSVVTGKTFVWSSSDEECVIVDNSGLATALADGNVTVSAGVDGVSGSATIVVEQRAATVEVTPGSDTLVSIGEEVQLDASVKDANDNPMDALALEWSSVDVSVAAVSGSGLVVAAGNGTTIVVAAANGVSDSASIHVSQAVSAVAVSPASATIDEPGGSVQLTAAITDANGHAVANASVDWASSDPTVASVDADGLVTGVADGSATVSATSEDKSGSAAIVVNGPQPVPPVAEIDNPGQDTTVTLGDAVDFQGTATDADGEVVAHRWDFGDGNEAAAEDPGEYTYAAPGTYTVTYQVTDDDGATSTPASIVVTVNTLPVAVMDNPSQDTTVILGDAIDFQGTATDADGEVITHSWNFGDGNDASVEDPGEYTYANPGTYTVTYQVTDDDGAISTPASIVVTVNALPVAVIDNPSQDTTVNVGDPVNFQGSATDADGDIVAHSWDFGDGREAAVEDPGDHVYENVGVYEVTYGVADDRGATTSSSITVTAIEPTPMVTGQWQSRQDPLEEFGISFVVNPEGTGITEITYYFDGFRCGWTDSWYGVVSKDSAYPGWPITDGKFDFWNYLAQGLYMRVDGTFRSDSLVSGSWSANVQTDDVMFPTVCNDMDPWALRGEPATKLYLRYDGVAPFLSHDPSPEGDDWVNQFANGETVEFDAILEAPIVSQDSAFSFAALLRYGSFLVTLDVKNAETDKRLSSWSFEGAGAFRYYGATLQGKGGGEPGDRLVLGITYSGPGDGNHINFGYEKDAFIVVPGRITISETRGAAPNAAASMSHSKPLPATPSRLIVVKPERR